MAIGKKAEKDLPKVFFTQSDEKREKVEFVYDEYDFMQDEVMQQDYEEFNDRPLKIFLDDSKKRGNGFIPSRDSQGKEEWQANVFSGTTRNKLRAYASSMAKEPPKMKFVAVNDSNERSVKRATVIENIVRSTYVQDNPALTMLYDGWTCSTEGTIVKYDGYMLVKDEVELVTSYDSTTGKVEIERKEVIVEDKHYEEQIPLTQFLIRDPYVRDVQDQPAVAWVRYMEHEDFMFEYGDYADADKVETKASVRSRDGELTQFFGRKLTDRIDENKVEVICYYRKRLMEDGKMRSVYRIVANGLLIFDGPLLWGRRKKVYPFAKSIFEPFANTNFFWGNSLPNILMAHQDVENRLTNNILDKTTRSLNTPMLVDMVNKQQMELEDSIIDGDTNIYVSNINGVKPMPVADVSQGELTMLSDVAQRLSMASVDSLQEGYGSSGSTAREIVIANEKSAEIKGIFYLLLSDLWIQKARLRTVNVLMQYNRPGNRYRIEDAELSDGTRGAMEIQVAEEGEIQALNAPAGYTPDGQPFNKLDIFEEEARLRGEPVEVVVVPMGYLDDWYYEIDVMTETMFYKARSLDMALEAEKLQATAELFPEYFMANKQMFFDGLMRRFGDDPRRFSPPQQQPAPMAGAPAPEGNPLGALGEQLAAPTQSLSALTGLGGQ